MTREEHKAIAALYDANGFLLSSAYTLRIIWVRIDKTNCWIIAQCGTLTENVK